MSDSIPHIENICCRLNDKMDRRLNNYHNILNKYNKLRKKMCLTMVLPKYIMYGGCVRLNPVNIYDKNQFHNDINKWYKYYNQLIIDTARLENKFEQNHIEFTKNIDEINKTFIQQPTKTPTPTPIP